MWSRETIKDSSVESLNKTLEVTLPIQGSSKQDLLQKEHLDCPRLEKEEENSILTQIIKNANISSTEAIRSSLTQTTRV